jgi:asparagine synthase (glutamine-hydrolysing)
MCGIAGFVGQGDRDDLTAMTQALVHRGPDGQGLWTGPQASSAPVYLGHRRLAIIDLQDGAQPMWTEDQSLAVTFNGEIYNHQELRKELEEAGHRFATDHCDTEVLLHGYRQWGDQLPNHLNGMWAFAIYDRQAGQIFLSRDRFGQKPLYFTKQGDLFAFSSELQSLIRHRDIKANIAPLSIKKYFAYGFIPSPHSLYESIHKLSAGHNLKLNIKDQIYKIEQYWNYVIEPFEQVPLDAMQQWTAELGRLLTQAVDRRLMSDVPLGVLLSGGLDSSCISALACRNSDAETVKTFSIGFDEPAFDESKYAAYVARFLKTDHHAQQLSIAQARSLMPDVVSRLDEPLGDSSLIPTYLVCGTARQKVTVVLGGDGADELLAGYDPFRALKLASIYKRMMPQPIHRAIRTALSFLPARHGYMSFPFKIKRVLRGLSYKPSMWNPAWLGPLEPSELADCFNEAVDLEEIYGDAIEHWDSCAAAHPVDRTTQFYVKMYLQDNILTKVDRASMMHSLEARAPFLDIDLVNFIRRLPHDFRYREGQTKFLLKRLAANLLPRQVIQRRKQGFALPVGPWFKDGSLDLKTPPMRTADPSAPQSGFVEKQLAQHRANRQDHRLFLWNQWVLDRFGTAGPASA